MVEYERSLFRHFHSGHQPRWNNDCKRTTRNKKRIVILEAEGFNFEKLPQDVYDGLTKREKFNFRDSYLKDSRPRHFGDTSNHWAD